MEVLLVHFYPDLMNLYGSWANLAVLRRGLERLGHAVTVRAVRPGERADLDGADFLYMGAGTERRQKFALADFAGYGADVRAAAEAGVPMLFAGTAMELLGRSVTDADGKVFEGIGLADFTAVQGKKRFVEDVYGHCALCDGPVVGFMNKCALIQGVASPLLDALEMGFGNEREKGAEGLRFHNVLGSELTGPLLVKNPQLLDWVLRVLCQRRGAAVPEAMPEDPHALGAWRTTAEQLRLRWERT